MSNSEVKTRQMFLDFYRKLLKFVQIDTFILFNVCLLTEKVGFACAFQSEVSFCGSFLETVRKL